MEVGTRQAATHELTNMSVTSVGRVLRRTKLDELPQIWNLLKGEMTLVGPRPCLVSQTELIKVREDARVLALTPGITGLAQVNGVDMSVPRDQPRCDFVHWVMADIPASVREIAAGSCSDGFVVKGKTTPAGPAGSRQGLNDFTGWFAGNPDMAGDYLGYDGPYPPFNDERVHRYFFRVFALDVASLQLPARFTAADDCAGLADEDLLARDIVDLDLYRPWGISVERSIELAQACEAAAFAVDKRITNSEGASVGTHDAHFVYGNSAGFMAGYPSSRHHVSCAVIAGKDDGMQRDDWYTSARDPDALEPAERVGAIAGERALKFGVGLADVLRMVTEFRRSDRETPIVLMGYANPIEAMGVDNFVGAAKIAGVDGVIVVDYPPEECEEFAALAKKNEPVK